MSRFPNRKRARCLVLLVAILAAVPGSAGESTSMSFRLERATTSAGGGAAASAGYALNVSAAQQATVGVSASPGFVLQSGFWGFAGSGLVPVLLSVDKNAVTPGSVDLSWSGNNAPYEIYESSDCSNVFSSWIDTTSANQYVDVTPPAASVVCYNVQATAPGPAPPPNP